MLENRVKFLMLMYVDDYLESAFMKNEIVCQKKENTYSPSDGKNPKPFRNIEPKKMKMGFSIFKGFNVSMQFMFGLKITFSKILS